MAPSIGLVRVGERGIVGVMPVDQREVKSYLQALGTKRIGILTYDVLLIWRMLDAVIGLAGMKHRVAVMMLGDEDAVLHAGGLGAPRDITRIELDRIKCLRGRMVILD